MDRGAVARPHARRQDRDGADALYLQMGNGCAGRGQWRAVAAGVRDAMARWCPDPRHAAVRRSSHQHDFAAAVARGPVCQGCDARSAQAGALDLRAYASPVAALSSGTQDRRAHAGAGARPDRDREHHAPDADDLGAHDRRVRAGARRIRARVRLALCAGGLVDDRAVSRPTRCTLPSGASASAAT